MHLNGYLIINNKYFMFYFYSFFYCMAKIIISVFNILYLRFIFNYDFKIFNLKVENKNDKIFILGSGNSINKLLKSEWDEIKSSTSIGINYFILNDFVPDIIQLELQSDSSAHLNNLKNIFNKRENDLKNTLILIKSNYFSIKEVESRKFFLKNIPESLKKNIRFSIDFPIVGKNKNQFLKSLKILNFFGIFNSNTLSVSPHVRASLGYSVVLASRLKFKKIILVGVDLKNTKYFFQDNLNMFYKKYEINKDFFIKNYFTVNKNRGHLTNDELVHEVTIIEALKLFFKVSNTDSVIFTNSKKSALYPTFNKY